MIDLQTDTQHNSLRVLQASHMCKEPPPFINEKNSTQRKPFTFVLAYTMIKRFIFIHCDRSHTTYMLHTWLHVHGPSLRRSHQGVPGNPRLYEVPLQRSYQAGHGGEAAIGG